TNFTCTIADMEASVATNGHHMQLETNEKGQNFRPLFLESFGNAAERNTIGTFEMPAARLRWMTAGFDGYSAHDKYASAGRGLFVSSLRRGGRDALAEYLPTDQWADWASHLFK